MGTPLYKPMKTKGTSFYAFPSAAQDLNLANYSDDYKMNFTKFALLNIPQQKLSRTSAEKPVMDFIEKSNTGDAPLYSTDPNANLPSSFSDQIVESLRNYVANYDSTLHESRITTNSDFYNIAERYTPTELIFWKWCRKMGLVDFEPAVHKVDWDKNLSDFDNPNADTTTNLDFFRKYLWKEREIFPYQVSSIEEASDYLTSGDYGASGRYTPKLIIDEQAKYKTGDSIILSGSSSKLTTGITYRVLRAEVSGSSWTHLWLDYDYQGSGSETPSNLYVKLDYDRLVNYVGEINAITNVQTATRTGQEVTAYISHHAGRTPTVLFGTRDNTNYYPNLEVPILDAEIQDEIVGSESLNSPLRTDPSDYPGSYFGQFDTEDQTYMSENGDKLRYQGDYYGIILTSNVELNQEGYYEELEDFNSNNIDGVHMDFDKNHYYKMSIPTLEVNNFDEFNSISIEEEPPEDFDFNAILWYYELVEEDSDGNLNSYINLYGIEFINNPDNDDDTDAQLITPYHKLVSNGEQDGLSYMFNINIHYNIDNDVLPLTYDPSTIYNMFGFDLYNEMMKKYYRVNENFIKIIEEFVRINQDVQQIKSIVYSQTDIDDLKSRMTNMTELLKLYSTNQFVDSDTAKISIDSSGVYPMLKFNVVGVEYDEIRTVYATDIYNFNFVNTGASYTIPMSFTNKMLLNIVNDNISTDSGNVSVVLDRDLRDKQQLDVVIKPDFAKYGQRLFFNIMFDYNNYKSEKIVFSVDLPIDVVDYDVVDPEASTFTNSYYTNENVITNSTDVDTGATYCATGFTSIVLTEDLFFGETGSTPGDYVYVQNLYMTDPSGSTVDLSGSYYILEKNGINITIDLKAYGYTLIGSPIVSYFRGIKVSMLRVDGTNSSTLTERYDISFELI